LSEPIGNDQWRTLGEAVAYRVVADLATTRITRPVLRVEPTLGLQTPAEPPAAVTPPTEPLDLRLEQRMAPR
ncbi:MAG TPA: hypothetical protein VM756_15140, partial [Burkholderiales bacterium]|nr:hypothetical protein [Burkholderiales bacterium]